MMQDLGLRGRFLATVWEGRCDRVVTTWYSVRSAVRKALRSVVVYAVRDATQGTVRQALRHVPLGVKQPSTP